MLKQKTPGCLSAAFIIWLVVLPLAKGESVPEFLRNFHMHPALTMERLPSLVDSRGEAQPRGFLNEKALREAFKHRMEVRSLITGLSANELGSAAPEVEKDLPEMLVDPGAPLERNLPRLQALGLMNVTAPVKPWADSYWPTYKGQTAHRYADPGFPNAKNWSVNYSYSQSHSAAAIVSTGEVSRINSLSPAEKYDFVMGDGNFTLTRFAWNQGLKLFNEGGVPTWMGICHGWAAASHMGAEFTSHPVIVTAQNGIPVTFYPQDIKALQSMLWANSAPASRFVGTRCPVSHPPRNGNGRILDPRCFDTNPATWHLIVANQLGRNHRSFVFDGTYDVEVWNFPILSARYRYFNPQTFEEKQNWAEAVIPLHNFRLDKFPEFRSHDARSIVGIVMDVTYVIEIEPGISRIFDAPIKTVRYIYDLELDAGNNAIGGEWYSNGHPDFIWTFPTGAQAMTADDSILLDDPWQNNGPVPVHWASYARKASSRGIPLFAFVKKVLDAAGPAPTP